MLCDIALTNPNPIFSGQVESESEKTGSDPHHWSHKNFLFTKATQWRPCGTRTESNSALVRHLALYKGRKINITTSYPLTFLWSNVSWFENSILQLISKDVFNSAKLKTCQMLSEWQPSINNTLWWCFQNCNGTVNYFFLETFISVLWIRTVHVILMWILIRMFSTVNVMVFLGEIFCYSC
jgi:hypothetical protein